MSTRFSEEGLQLHMGLATIKLVQLLNDVKAVQIACDALLRSATISLWTAFECLSGAVWRAALNARLRSLAQLTRFRLTDDEQMEGLSRKAISVSILARYNFNLQDHLGSVLAEVFDFTGINGISRAYQAVLGKKNPVLNTIFIDSQLSTLEKLRHLSAHRGGIVDHKFVNVTKINTQVGETFPLTGAFVTDIGDNVVLAGCTLLHFVDEWLEQHPE